MNSFTTTTATGSGSSTPTTAETILENSLGPKRVSGDSGSVEQFSVADQILADRYRRSLEASSIGFGGMKHIKLVPPGASDSGCADGPFNILNRCE